MSATLTKHERNLSAIVHASTFSKYFIPFGNFILPLILWSANKRNSEFVDFNGKQVINFQMSMLLYSLIAGVITIPFLISFIPDIFDGGFWGFDRLNDYNNMNIHISSDNFKWSRWFWPAGIGGLLQVAIMLTNLIFTILGTIRTNDGQRFTYPVTIPFIK